MSASVPETSSGSSAQEEGNILCPFCGDNVPGLIPVESGMLLRLQQEAQIGQVPDAVCEGCFKQLSKSISKGAVLRAEQQHKEQNRVMLWRNRVQLVKQAKQHLAQKNYSDAAVSYEKYVRVLEIVYEQKPGELSPALFKNEARAQEMTVIASVYWDLMRIYDTHATYRERQMRAAEKLAEFVRFTPVFPHIIRKAESQARSAKNPDAFNKFLKLSHAKRPRCFIATAAFDGYQDPVVDALCDFRDHYLKTRLRGRRWIRLYYRHSPGIASFLDRAPALKPATRRLLTWIANSRFVRKRLSRR